MFEAWSVAIRLKLIDGVSGGLIGLSRHFAAGNMQAKEFQRRLEGIQRTMAVGAGFGLVGAGMFRMLDKTIPAAKELADQMSLMNTLGMKQADIAGVVRQAWKTSWDVPTTTAAENLKTFRELRSVFGVGHESEASAMLPVVGRIQGVLTALTGHEQEKVGFDLVKAIELRTGVMTQAALQKNAELMSRTIIGMGGTVTVSDFHGALKMGKMATNKWDDDFTYNYLPTLMQELKTASGGGAQSAGTALMSLYQQVHGRMTKAAMPLWVQAGLLNQSDIVKNATGQWQMKPGSVKGIGVEETNPFEWVQNYLKPAVDRVAAARKITPETVIDAMFSNRNAAFAAYNMYTKAAQYERDKQTIGQADSYTGYQKLLQSNPSLASMALQKQWQNLLAQIGFSIMPDLIRGTQALLPILRDLSQWAQHSPEQLRWMVRGFVALGGAMLFVSGLLTAKAGFGAIKFFYDILKAARGLAGPEVSVASRNAGSIVTGLRTVSGGLSALSLIRFAAIGTGIGLLVGSLAGVAGMIKNAWDQAKKNDPHFGLPDLFPSTDAVRGPAQGAVPPPTKPHVVVKHNVKMDHHGFISWVGDELGKMAGSVQIGSSTYDPTMSPAGSGMGYFGGR